MDGDDEMKRFSEGGVRIDIPDKRDPDQTVYHGKHGTVVNVLADEADMMTGDDRDAFIYQVQLETGEQADFRWRDLRSSLDK